MTQTSNALGILNIDPAYSARIMRIAAAKADGSRLAPAAINLRGMRRSIRYAARFSGPGMVTTLPDYL